MTRHDFKFSHVFTEFSSQADIFDAVARRIVDRFTQGYNGTIFAYGQTSTGKTYTIEGSLRHREKQGLVPRSESLCTAVYIYIEQSLKIIDYYSVPVATTISSLSISGHYLVHNDNCITVIIYTTQKLFVRFGPKKAVSNVRRFYLCVALHA